MEQFSPPDTAAVPTSRPSTPADVSMPPPLAFAPPSAADLAPPTQPAPPALTPALPLLAAPAAAATPGSPSLTPAAGPPLLPTVALPTGPPVLASAAPPLAAGAPPMGAAPVAPSAPTPPTMVPVVAQTLASKKPRRGMFVAGMGAVALAAVAAGAFIVTRDDAANVVVDDATELSTELSNSPSPQDTAGYSFAAATVSAQAAASVVFDMEIVSPEGPMSATASFDKASGRMAMDLDMSQLVEGDEAFIEIGDSLSFIIDEPNHVAYVGADFLAGFLGSTDASWISLTTDEFSVDDDVFGDVFANPLDIADVFGGLEPLDIGEETVNGELLRHYEVTIDETTIADLDGDLISDDLAAEILGSDDLAVLGGGVTYGVWVDEASQIRRMTFDVADGGEVGSVELWINISAEPLDIALPSPDDVVDMAALFGDF